MIKAIETRNTKAIATMMGDNAVYCIEGVIKECGRWNNKHAEYRFWFDGKSELPSLTIRVRRTFNKRFSASNQRITMTKECPMDPKDSKALIKWAMDRVGVSHDIEIEKDYLRN